MPLHNNTFVRSKGFHWCCWACSNVITWMYIVQDGYQKKETELQAMLQRMHMVLSTRHMTFTWLKLQWTCKLCHMTCTWLKLQVHTHNTCSSHDSNCKSIHTTHARHMTCTWLKLQVHTHNKCSSHDLHVTHIVPVSDGFKQIFYWVVGVIAS